LNCKICLKEINDGESRPDYHRACLLDLFGDTKANTSLPYSPELFYQQVREAATRGRMSISGVQPKAQMTLSDNKEIVVVESGGNFILKPTPAEYPEAAANEHLSMLLAKKAGFEIPKVGLVSFQNSEPLCFIVRRFDRLGKHKRHHEDMMQVFGISNKNSDNKYESKSYLDVMTKLRELGGIALAMEGFKRILFAYLIGNNDYHLKNISIMHEPQIQMSPYYDSINAQLYSSIESPMALDLSANDRELEYFGKMGNGRYSGSDFKTVAALAGILEKPASKAIEKLTSLTDQFNELIDRSYLSTDKKAAYKMLIERRKTLLRI